MDKVITQSPPDASSLELKQAEEVCKFGISLLIGDSMKKKRLFRTLTRIQLLRGIVPQLAGRDLDAQGNAIVIHIHVVSNHFEHILSISLILLSFSLSLYLPNSYYHS